MFKTYSLHWFGWIILGASPCMADSSGLELFEQTIQPVLKQQCLGCHGEGNTFSKLDLRTRDAALQGGQRGPAIVPGNPGSGTLLNVLEHNGDIRMPPGEEETRLAPEIIKAFRDWVVAGAPYSELEKERVWDFAEEDLWPFQTVAEQTLSGQGKNSPVDTFIQTKLDELGLKPAPRAGRRTLLRRLTYNLTGLPPTPEEMAEFVDDPSQDAYARAVERLLGSPQYGERWGRHWLDVARYADTAGYSNDFERPSAWRYRDYVIRSFNNDKPYDKFILEQVAGDEIFPENPDALLATGFLRTGPWEHTGMSVAAVTRQQYLDDVTHHIGQTFLGMTLGCARCHDHKFDPISTEEYYSMQAVFATTAFARQPLEFQANESRAGFEEGRQYFQEMTRQIDELREELLAPARVRLAAEKGQEEADKASSNILQRYMDQEQAETLKLFSKQRLFHEVSQQRYEPVSMTVSSGLQMEWNDLWAGASSYLKEKDYETAETRILVGGDLQSPDKTVSPGVLEAVARYSTLPAPVIPQTVKGRRSALARWIADPRNPLTARVMVNRIWQFHFGRGLAGNSNNFGKMGAKPTHPELLDWLAGYFIQQDWSIKEIHRMILLSETYQRSGAHPNPEQTRKQQQFDPDNLYLARFTPRRLEAEELRDSILAVSGALSPSRGGPGTHPQINKQAARQPRHVMGTLKPVYQPAPKRSDRNRRSVYSFLERSLLDPMIEVFNGPNPDLSCEMRESSTVPTQAFTLMNSELSHEMALTMALRLENESESLEDGIQRAFQLAYGRNPTAKETEIVKEHQQAQQSHHENHPVDSSREEPEPVITELTSELTGVRFRILQPQVTLDYEHNPYPGEAGASTRALADLALVLFNSNEFAYVY